MPGWLGTPVTSNANYSNYTLSAWGLFYLYQKEGAFLKNGRWGGAEWGSWGLGGAKEGKWKLNFHPSRNLYGLFSSQRLEWSSLGSPSQLFLGNAPPKSSPKFLWRDQSPEKQGLVKRWELKGNGLRNKEPFPTGQPVPTSPVLWLALPEPQCWPMSSRAKSCWTNLLLGLLASRLVPERGYHFSDLQDYFSFDSCRNY